MIHWLQVAIRVYLLHPLVGRGGAFWSGPGSDIGEITLLGGVVAVAKHHNCHHKGCWMPGHRHPEHGWPSCKTHWRETPAHISQTSGGAD